MMKVNRRSIYNWFGHSKLKPEIIFKIGSALRHDFSTEFPELFASEDFRREFNKPKISISTTIQQNEEISFWKDKYISLLEQYSKALSHSNAHIMM